MAKFVPGIILLIWAIYIVDAKRVTGKIHTSDKWRFVARFAFIKTGGVLEYSVDYPTRFGCCLQLAYYDATTWPSVYPGKEPCCRTGSNEGELGTRRVVLMWNSSTQASSHSCREDKSLGLRLCSGTLRFESREDRWWFFAFRHCNSSRGLDLAYDFVFTNGDSWERHLSADEMHILEMDASFLLAGFLVVAIALLDAKMLQVRDFLHPSYKLFLLSLCVEIGSLIFETAYYLEYVLSGRTIRAVLVLGNLLDAVGEITFAFLLVLMAKGWTITRGRLSRQTRAKLGIFFSFYTLSYGVLFIYDIQLFDPGVVLYRYDSPAGRGMLVLRLIAWVWFIYAIHFTTKYYPEKTSFYLGLAIFLSIWFLAKPVLVFLGFFVIEDSSRTKICSAVEMTICFIGHVEFLYLLRPSSNVHPFHVCTTQVAAMPPGSDPNFQHTEAFGRLSKNETGALESSLTELRKIAATPSCERVVHHGQETADQSV